MAKGKITTAFFCNECGYESSKWMGQCPACRQWNTFTEEPIKLSANLAGQSGQRRVSAGKPTSILDVSADASARISSDIKELDRVLGGGIVPGSLVLVGGDPGIGKSTLLLQTCRNLSGSGHNVLYISGEESLNQIKLRADRIGSFTANMKLMCETDLELIAETIRTTKPEIVIIDSIQTMCSSNVSSAPGSVSQVREATNILMQLAKNLTITIFIVGHVTKEGTVAGPRVLEHMVDTVLYFEGDRYASYRILRGVKNRFGSTNEVGVFEMRQEGLAEVMNPSEYMLAGRPQDASGSIAFCALEGTRPLLLEIQALVCRTAFGFPRRQTTGCDLNRVNLLMAVLEKRSGIAMGEYDAYVNVTGGMKMNEPAIDLPIALATVSSYKNIVLDEKIVAFGEIGLSGEVRSVSMPEQRVQEAIKLGFTKIFLPKSCLPLIKNADSKYLYGVESLSDAIKIIEKTK